MIFDGSENICKPGESADGVVVVVVVVGKVLREIPEQAFTLWAVWPPSISASILPSQGYVKKPHLKQTRCFK